VLALILGAFSGVLLGLTGGGSIVTIPILIYVLHFSYHSATTISLIVVGFSALLGAILKNKEIEYRSGIIFVICGVIFTPFGIKLSQLFSTQILMLAFAL